MARELIAVILSGISWILILHYIGDVITGNSKTADKLIFALILSAIGLAIL